MNLKKLFFIIFCIPITITAQVPQGIGYQGVATDATGFELINQSISIRASIISGSPNGTVEWQETHSAVTDSFGLFTISIGQGTSTTNGTLSSFDDISWGTNTHFLKIEMDINGGSNYSLIGTNQMMSVPYALYAESANINYDSIATILSNDSTFANNISDKSGSCNFNYPDGIYGDVVIWDVATSGDYVIPAGKNFYLQWLSLSASDYLYVNGQKILTVPGSNSGTTAASTTGSRDNITLTQTLIFKEGDVLSFFNTSGIKLIAGLLTEKKVEALISGDLVSNTYTVPIGKRLVIKGIYASNNSYSFLRIDNKRAINIDHHLLLNEPIIVNEGSLIDLEILSSNYHNGIIFNGYLVDEDYFAECGGVRNSSTTTVDSSYIDSLVQFYSTEIITNGSISPYHPEGLDGIEYVSNNNPYTVPSGKTFYMYTELANLEINGIDNVVSDDHYFPIPIAENSTLDYSGTWQLRGYLIEKGYEVINYLGGSTNYTVPSDSYLYILNSLSGLTINSNFVSTSSMGGQYLTPPYVLQPSDVVSSVKGFNGILIPLENLGSSSLSSNITSSSNSFNSNLSSGTLGVGSSYTETNIIDTILVPENSFVEIDGYYNRTSGTYSSNTDSQVFVEDLLGNTIDFNTVSSGGSSNSILSSNITTGSGTFKMKRFFSNETTIIIFNKLSGQHCCHAYLSGGGVSFTINGFTTVNSF